MWVASVMEDEPKLIHSPLDREVSQGGVSVRIFIYRAEDETTWLLEIEDHLRGSTVWNDRFPTDQAALDEALKAIEEEGLESFAQGTSGS